jgi:aminoglycoside phosphotransferase (APT) family kinase protein
MIDLRRVRDLTGRSFAERDLVVLPRDGFTLVVLADDLMAYIPTDESARMRLAAQRRMLARVGSRVPFAVPRPVGPIESDLDLRTPAPGMTGSVHHEKLLADPDLAVRAAEWMGRSLAVLEGSLAKTVLDALAVPRPTWPRPREQLARDVDALLDGDLRDAASRTLRSWYARPAEPDVLLHGDFASHNFAFDATSGMPTGLFDFHDGGRGPRVLDFALLPSYGDAVLERALAVYGPAAPPLEDVRLAHAVSAMSYLPFRERSSAVAWVKSALSAAGFSIL